MELAIDTSGEVACVGLAERGEVLTEVSWKVEANHTTEVGGVIEWVLCNEGVQLKEIGVFTVVLGPGKYSGLRVGVSLVKGLAFALRVPMVGVSMLEVEAMPFSPSGFLVRPLIEVGRGQLATSLFKLNGDHLERFEADRLTTVQEIIASTSETTVFCGDGHLPFAGLLTDSLGSKAVLPFGPCPKSSSSVASLGWKKLADGGVEDLDTVQPVYLRDPSITQSAKLQRP